jgi:biotin carboxyl carrier protein
MTLLIRAVDESRGKPALFILPIRKELKMAQENVQVPITGKIISVNVKAGDKVQEGDIICILESMKMENPILAPTGGTIAQIAVAADQTVKPGDTIAVIEYE